MTGQPGVVADGPVCHGLCRAQPAPARPAAKRYVMWKDEMKDFPGFMKSTANRIDQSSQYTEDIEGYVFDGKDGSQMAFWTCHQDRVSKEHVHAFDEYMIVAQGEYTVDMRGHSERLLPGQELHIPKGTPHSGKALAGTRTIRCFGGKRVCT